MVADADHDASVFVYEEDRAEGKTVGEGSWSLEDGKEGEGAVTAGRS